jgi:hypothetical protein
MKSSAFPALDGLVDLACRDGVDIRPTLLRVLTDLYVAKPDHSAEEVAQFSELALGLIDAADNQTRATVSARLSQYSGTPAAIRQKLGIGGPQSSAQGDAEASTLTEQFFAATAPARRLMVGGLDAAAHAPAQPAKSSSGEIIRRLETAAMQHNTGEFSRTLQRALGIGGELAERVARDQSGEPIVIAAKALGMTAAVLQRILLFLNPAIGQSVERVHDLARFFDEMRPEAAHAMVAVWRSTSPGSTAVHNSAPRENEPRGARRFATPAGHKTPSQQNEIAARLKSGQR